MAFAVYLGIGGINTLRDPKIECFEAKFERSYKSRESKSVADYYFEGEERLRSAAKSKEDSDAVNSEYPYLNK